MKTTNRIPKAIAIIVILGLGLVHNLDNKEFLTKSFNEGTEEWENAEVSDTLKTSENKLFIFTRSIIKTSIQHLISNI